VILLHIFSMPVFYSMSNFLNITWGVCFVFCISYIRDYDRYILKRTTNCFVTEMLYGFTVFILLPRNKGFSLHLVDCNFSSSLQRKMLGASCCALALEEAACTGLAGSTRTCCTRELHVAVTYRLYRVFHDFRA
jgi:hypothetical protein